MDYISLQEKRGANYILIEAKGALTSNTFTELQLKSFDFLTQTSLVLDLSEISKIDSSGMSVIMALHNEAEALNQQFYLMRPSFEAKKAIENTGFLDTFNIIQSVTEVV